jgi:hypothetical protein
MSWIRDENPIVLIIFWLILLGATAIVETFPVNFLNSGQT